MYLIHLLHNFVAAKHHGFVLALDVVLTIIVIESLGELLGLLANLRQTDILQVATEVAHPFIALFVGFPTVKLQKYSSRWALQKATGSSGLTSIRNKNNLLHESASFR
jgi:hypothetical protein